MSSTQHDAAAWTDFENLRHSVKSYTVDRLKQIIAGLSEECSAQLSKTGKKQDLIDRITGELDKYRYKHDLENWNRARSVLHQVRTSGCYTGSSLNHSFSVNPSFSSSNTHGSTYAPGRSLLNPHQPTSVGSSSSIARYDPYAPPRRPVQGSSTSAPARPTTTPGIRFKSSPFLKVDQAVSDIVECPESTGSMDRRTAMLQFSLSQVHVSKLMQSGSKYQLRLFCTSNIFYSAPGTGFRTSGICPIEFPATCEVRVNNTYLQANLKGIKKKPGTAPPADVTKLVRMTQGVPNKIDMVYVNSQVNAPPKKFFLVVFLVEISTVDQLVERLRKGKFRHMDEVKAQMVKAIHDDDEIVAGKQKMTLKCPLSYTRIKVPSRSEKCVHSQCFDAYSWYSVMEQTTTYLCPVCEKVLNPEELIVDGYFANILEQTPESIEEVEVEPDGEWHTLDYRYSSPGWLQQKIPQPSPKMPSPFHGTFSSTQIQTSPSDAPQAAQNTDALLSVSAAEVSGEVFVLSDSDNEDEGRVKKELSPNTSTSSSMINDARNSAPPAASSKLPSVIDLTLDSDSEDNPSAPRMPSIPPISLKRKSYEASSDTGDANGYKKLRFVDELAMLSSRKEANGYSQGTAGPPLPVAAVSEVELASRTLPPLTRSISGVSSVHHSQSSLSAAPMYYTHGQVSPLGRAHQFVPYLSAYRPSSSTSTNGTGLNAGTEGARGTPRPMQSGYHAYIPRANGNSRTQWS